MIIKSALRSPNLDNLKDSSLDILFLKAVVCEDFNQNYFITHIIQCFPRFFIDLFLHLFYSRDFKYKWLRFSSSIVGG